jgi:hypothetical protein
MNGVVGLTVRSTIESVFEQVALDQQRMMPPLADDVQLLHSGLDSLSFAIIVAPLEDSLAQNPFNTDEAIQLPGTFGDFVRLYEKPIPRNGPIPTWF